MPADFKRIAREIKDYQSDSDQSTVYCELIGNNHLKGLIKGPDGTAYQKGWFMIDIRLDAGYPFYPPKVKFDTKVWHPNISSESGAICLDILTSKAWSPALNIKSILLSLLALLQSPIPDDPQDAEVARQLLSNPQEFQNTAEFWTDSFAAFPSQEQIGKIIEILPALAQNQMKVRLQLLMNDMQEEKTIQQLSEEYGQSVPEKTAFSSNS
ncbi:hypothetical protein MP228_001933 [Amoeboaphelidium protococcarum]|nr:hypothetical protein MP228_001933 [Amoeboaphelidium protococcarum]